MKALLRHTLGMAPANGGHPIAAQAAQIHYALAAFRWHLDGRTPAKVVALHDLLSTSASWQQLLHEGVTALPLSRLSPSDPLEVYCADLRGHNLSSTVPMGDASDFALTCAADIIELEESLALHTPRLAGIGFGALVAVNAALCRPDKFSALSLFVDDASQLFSCEVSRYKTQQQLLTPLRGGAPSLAAFHEQLASSVPDLRQRAIHMQAVERVEGGQLRLRMSDELLSLKEGSSIRSLLGDESCESVFSGPVSVFLCGSGAESITAEQQQQVKKRFPAAKILALATKGESLMSPKVPVVPLMLQSFQLLGEVKDE